MTVKTQNEKEMIINVLDECKTDNLYILLVETFSQKEERISFDFSLTKSKEILPQISLNGSSFLKLKYLHAKIQEGDVLVFEFEYLSDIDHQAWKNFVSYSKGSMFELRGACRVKKIEIM